jgi:hypothetical protein
MDGKDISARDSACDTKNDAMCLFLWDFNRFEYNQQVSENYPAAKLGAEPVKIWNMKFPNTLFNNSLMVVLDLYE